MRLPGQDEQQGAKPFFPKTINDGNIFRLKTEVETYFQPKKGPTTFSSIVSVNLNIRRGMRNPDFYFCIKLHSNDFSKFLSVFHFFAILKINVERINKIHTRDSNQPKNGCNIHIIPRIVQIINR